MYSEKIRLKDKLLRIPAAAWADMFAIILIVLYFVLRNNRAAAQFLSDNFSVPVRRALGLVTGVVPFSVMELMYVVVFVWVVWFVVRSVKRIRAAGEERMREVMKRVLTFALVPLYIWAGYCYLWGIDYFTATFAEESGMRDKGIAIEELYVVTAYFLEKAGERSKYVERDESLAYNEDVSVCFEDCLTLYDAMEEEFPCLEGVSYRPKKMAASYVMSVMNFTGVYFPFTGESNINVHQPDFTEPFTIAHELAHQRGVFAEQECNFLGVLACTKSENALFNYAGYFVGLVHLSNALYAVSPELWETISYTFTPELHADWLVNRDYWRSFKSKVSETSEKVYDGYLKFQGQPLGIKSYGACVDLIVEYFADEAFAYYGLTR